MTNASFDIGCHVLLSTGQGDTRSAVLGGGDGGQKTAAGPPLQKVPEVSGETGHEPG